MSTFKTFTTGLCLLILPSLLQASVIPSDIAITANIAFDDDPATGSFDTTGRASQSAIMDIISSGSVSSSSVAGLVVSGDNPLTGSINETGDGMSIAADILGGPDSTADGFFFDYSLGLTNSSSVNDYMLVFQIVLDNFVSANPNDLDPGDFDGFADSKSFLERSDTGEELFFTDITSDSFGDQIAGAPTDPATAGADIFDARTIDIQIMLPRNGAFDLFGDMQLSGLNAIVDTSGFSVSQALSISLLSVNNLTQPPTAASAPSAALLITLSLLLLVRARNRV
ncbi:MAG: hypothetical protein WA981_04925 [Glaciecola sp.]